MTNTVNELEKLRDILYGEQMRVIAERLNELEKNLQLISEQINGKIGALDTENKQNFSQQTDEMKRLAVEQNKKLQEQSNGLVGQINGIRELVNQEVKDSQQRDEALKKDILDLLAKLETSKATRAELGQVLIEMGKAIQHAK